MSRVAILGAYRDDFSGIDTLGTWSRILVGEPNYIPDSSQTCLSNIRVCPDQELTATVYLDQQTGVVYMEDKNGNEVDYYLSWVGNDDDEVYMTIEEYANMNFNDYYEGLSSDDRRMDLDRIEENTDLTLSLFDGTYLQMKQELKEYIHNDEEETTKPEEETTEPEDETGKIGDGSGSNIKDAVIVSLDNAKGKPGEEVSVNVLVDKNIGTIVSLLDLSYDSSLLTVTNIESKDLFNLHNGMVSDYRKPNLQNNPITIIDGYVAESHNSYATGVMYGVFENGVLRFETEHFSKYVVTDCEIDISDEESEVIISGDVNGDGLLDIKDSTLIKRHLAGWEVKIDEDAADVNGDGIVDVKDSALVKRSLAGWDVVLGKH